MNDVDWSVWEPRFAEFVQSRAADAAHDAEHLRRVVATAQALARREHADLHIVVPAAWLHDCVHVPKNSPDRSVASRLAAAAAVHFLRRIGYPEHVLPAIAHAIEAPSFSAGIAPRTVEARVVQDADRLDALGAIGIARCLLLGGAMGTSLYHASEPFPERRPPDDACFVLDHFFVKLLGLAESMQTAAGRREAQRRVSFMRLYLEQLRGEISGAEAW